MVHPPTIYLLRYNVGRRNDDHVPASVRWKAVVIRLANDTIYGLAAYVQSSDIEHARKVASQMRAGNVHLNYPAGDTAAPFGGYKQSGNGREYGKWGLEEFLETKAVIGYQAA